MGMEEGRLLQAVCYSAGDETGGWIWRRGRRDEDLQLAHMLP